MHITYLSVLLISVYYCFKEIICNNICIQKLQLVVSLLPVAVRIIGEEIVGAHQKIPLKVYWFKFCKDK